MAFQAPSASLADTGFVDQRVVQDSRVIAALDPAVVEVSLLLHCRCCRQAEAARSMVEEQTVVVEVRIGAGSGLVEGNSLVVGDRR